MSDETDEVEYLNDSLRIMSEEEEARRDRQRLMVDLYWTIISIALVLFAFIHFVLE